MATVSETELEQKTSEYVEYVKTLFQSTGKDAYKSSKMRVYVDGVFLILEHEGK